MHDRGRGVVAAATGASDAEAGAAKSSAARDLVRIEHVALWTRDLDSLERLRVFYTTYFGAAAGPRYASARRLGFASYFVQFPSVAGEPPNDGSTRLELMTVPELVGSVGGETVGYAHLALAVGSHDAVDRLVARLREDGVAVVSGPRLTGDGDYEAAVRDPDGNLVEVMADPRPAEPAEPV